MPAFEAGVPIGAGQRVVLADEATVHHLLRVLRLRSGDSIRLFHDGTVGTGIVERTSANSVAVVIESSAPSLWLNRPLNVVQALIRPQLLDDVVRLCTPLGVTNIVLFRSARAQSWNVEARMERLQEIAAASAEQSETGIIPRVHLAQDIGGALDCAQPLGRLFVLSPQGGGSLLQVEATGQLAPNGSVTVVIGPEGGLTPSEEDQLVARGATSVRLRTGILRSELAGFATCLVIRELQTSP
jgi:16S rRNA (uracil1498-N3)-methyltransferase